MKRRCLECHRVIVQGSRCRPCMRAKWRRESPAKNGKRPGAARSSIPRQVKERDQRACVICGSSYGLQVHHVVPISEGGSHDPSNLVTLCAKHHRQAHHG